MMAQLPHLLLLLSVVAILISPTASAFFAPSIARAVVPSSTKRYAATTQNEQSITFDELKSIESRLINLEKESPEILSSFYEPHLKSFSVRPGSTSSLSVTSTCFALQSISGGGDKFDDFVDFNMKLSGNYSNATSTNNNGKLIPLRGVVKAVLRASWREEDLFQVPILLSTVLKIDSERSILNSSMDEELSHRFKKLIAATLDSRPKRRNGINQPMSDYILYLLTDSLASLVESTPPRIIASSTKSDDDEVVPGLGNLPASLLPEGAASSTLLALTRCVEVSYNELCRQLAFRSAGDSTSFDVIRLAYSLLTYIRASNALVGTAGREVIKGKGPAAGTAVGTPNKRLVKAALHAFFAEQSADGTWDKGQPIFVSFRRKRDVGNAFVFGADTVGQLLDALPAEDFRPHLDGLERLLSWIEQHQVVEIIPDYCDPYTGQCYGTVTLQGWNSPHMTSTQSSGPAAWSTAQAITCIMRMKKVVQRLLHVDVLEEFRGTSNNGIVKFQSWDRLLDTDLGDPSTTEGCRTLKDVLNERMIQPFSKTSTLPTFGAAYSSILFGPPGTAKSTICFALSEKMGWDFVTIDTAEFLADGLTCVASRIKYVFARLQSLNDCVILFDEIEEFCLDRESPGLGMESRMLTTAMLTAINDLRRAKKSIFFLATNRLRAFDSAIIRPGRFDMQLFVGTPNLEARVIQLRGQLASLPLNQSVKDETEEAFRNYLSSVWCENVMFFNYLEGIQFAIACARVVANNGETLTAEKMEDIVKAQAMVMTVRGQVRDEYVSSMNLSRL